MPFSLGTKSTVTAPTARKPMMIEFPKAPSVGLPKAPSVGLPKAPSVGLPKAPSSGLIRIDPNLPSGDDQIYMGGSKYFDERTGKYKPPYDYKNPVTTTPSNPVVVAPPATPPVKAPVAAPVTTPVTAPVASPVTESPITSSFTFPLDKYPQSYSGPTSEVQGMLNKLLPTLESTFTNYPGQRQAYYNQARGDITQGFNDASTNLQSTFTQNLKPALQNVLNQLASRNMINSSVAGDTMAQASRGVMQDIFGKQAEFDLAKQAALADIAKTEGTEMSKYPTLLTDLARLGQYSETKNELAPYQSSLDFMQALMA